MRISGCVAIVTGGCQGIGKGILYALLRKNAKVSSNIILIKYKFVTAESAVYDYVLAVSIHRPLI